MPSRNRTSRTLRVLLVAASVGALAVGGGLVLSGYADASSDAKPEHRAFALSGKALTVDDNDGDVRVQPADVSGVQVTRWFDASTILGAKPSAAWSMEDGTLKLRTHCVGLISHCSIRYEILVPRDVAVTVSSGNGAVSASGFATALKIDTGNGTVDVGDSTGDLTLGSDNGKVIGTGLRSRQVHAQSSNGQVRLGFAAVPDQVEGITHNGSVTVDLPPATYKVTAETGNGRTRVDVPQDPRSGHVVTARSANGSVTVRGAS
ncbi:DUF4097 family beta strand repeat-containing protein [Streptomyces sp. NPDC020096]